MDNNERRAAWEERYRAGPRPWDTGITPPEVVAFWQQQPTPPVGLAVDIGCGTGTNAAYLAGLGLSAIGADLSLTALLLAQQRRETLALPVQQRLHFAQADVSRLPFHNANAVYILDVGCFHALPIDARRDYAKGIVHNLAPGGHFHLYAFDRLPEEAGDPDARGFGETEVVDLFSPGLSVVEIIRARPDRKPCRWYLLRKR
ncbi:MAG: class I SAM-dependent methyltransferase [Caldilineaceae bacterium]|nr:class I SAM-dependent methyltransferase [Caldilineaceae bacterium]HRJ42099.1 class I SAM-dependent methyltransferase [Caldilineaceae bacterium]